ncbi:MAG: YraN family protein [Candidatus Cloacimonetes bacterium]|jgi:putative endonuclease|nr:YraN family protein [Candidatus Cloacimonadota bacterium]MDD2422730.1 YraN family protein [Candidatus Cloacimonadota bacterium]MDD3562880.1 YraN family protein [Candidatus Cloacimonadota bacterium]MDD4276880.1 YraN family protein [Candidatus Cloacimonadota bacterium]MDY0324566.1 YraN family protein [Candidatus Cloacimonadaceae bacterium]
MDKISKQDLARLGENVAASYLVSNGYSVVCKNFRVQQGEIDLIVEKNQQLIFVEVKTRSYHSMDSVLANVNYRKQLHISRVAQEYCRQNPQFDNYNTRFDVIIVFRDKIHGSFSVKHFIDAFLPVSED